MISRLNTGFYIHGPVDGQALYDFALSTLLTAENHGRKTSSVTTTHKKAEGAAGSPGVWVRTAPEEQPDAAPLPATLSLWYRKDGSPVLTQVQADREWKNCKRECAREDHCPPYHMLMGLSTSLFWDDDARDWNPGDLASAALWQIGGWLDTHKVKWSWRNELINGYTTGYDQLEGLHTKMVELREKIAGQFFGQMGGFMVIPLPNLFADDDD